MFDMTADTGWWFSGFTLSLCGRVEHCSEPRSRCCYASSLMPQTTSSSHPKPPLIGRNPSRCCALIGWTWSRPTSVLHSDREWWETCWCYSSCWELNIPVLLLTAHLPLDVDILQLFPFPKKSKFFTKKRKVLKFRYKVLTLIVSWWSLNCTILLSSLHWFPELWINTEHSQADSLNS